MPMQLFKPVKPTILVVDDTAANLSLISSLLQHLYTVKAVNHGAKALTLVEGSPPDLILLDIVMPDLDGYEVCRRLKAQSHTSQIPVIFLTSKSDVHSEQMGMDLGAVDYVTRPISPPILISRVKAHLNDAMQARTLRVNNEYLEYEITRRAKELVALQDVTMLAMASLAETRDADTGNHLRRTQQYVRALARHLRKHARFSHYLTPDRIEILFKCAPLHDIGKVGIPDRILLKPGRLTADEMAVMQQHPALGHAALVKAQAQSDFGGDFLDTAREIVYSHHEKWDGSGYPRGLVGDQIPIAARLMAVADVYDALISNRVYKSGMPHESAFHIIEEGRGRHFDPDVVDAAVSLADEFLSIAQRFADSETDLQQKILQLNSLRQEER